MEQVEHRDGEEHEREHRQTDAQPPGDPAIREQFQGVSDL
jgi:hypothetical protein